MNSNFIHIHTHNEYSFLDGYGKADKYISRAKELGQVAIALTNHGNVDGCLKFQEACKGKDITPIFGAELYFVSDRSIKDKSEKRSHILIIAKTETGWINLLKLITISNLEGFHVRPRIDEESLLANKEGLIVSTACSSSIINRPDGFELLTRLKEAFGEDLYAEIMPFNYAPQRETNLKAIDFANKLSLKILASNDCHYIYDEDSKLQEVLLAIQRNTKWKDPTRWKFDIDGLFLKSKREMIQSFISLGYIERSVYLNALDNTEEIFDKCKDFSLSRISVCLPEVPGYEKHDPVELFRTLVNTEYDRRKSEFGEFGSEKEYFERKEEELNLIIDLGFSKYFIIIWELMCWCKENDILTGIGRGCFTGETKISLLNGTEKTFEELVDSYSDKKFWVYSCSKEGKIVPGLAKNPRITKIAKKLCVITLDNGEEIKCTPEHRFLMRDGKYKMAEELCVGSSLMPFYRIYTSGGYERVFDNKVNSFISSSYLEYIFKKGFVVHHKDFDKRNNCPDNLKQMTNKEHGDLHGNKNRKRWMDESWRVAYKERSEEYWSGEESALHREKLIKHNKSEKMREMNRKRYHKGLGSIENREKTKKRNKSEIMRKKVSEGQKKIWANESYRKKVQYHLDELNCEDAINKRRKMLCERNKSEKMIAIVVARNKSSEMREKVSIGRKKYFLTEKGIKEKQAIRERMSKLRKDGTIVSPGHTGKTAWNKDKKLIDGKYCNHKIVSIKFIDTNVKVYDIEVEKYNNFALSSGVFVHNSVGGSLIAYLLGITSVDPIRYGLIFARFISPARIDLPDVDMDFEDSKRPLVRKHLEDLYGKYCVAGCSTFSSMQGRGALRDVSRIFEVPVSDVSKASASIVTRSGGDFRCLSEDNLVYTRKGKKRIGDLKVGEYVVGDNGDGIKFKKVSAILDSGEMDVYEVTLESGKKIICTEDHKFFIDGYWKKANEIKINELSTVLTGKDIENINPFGIIYKAINILNGRIYIGQTKGLLGNRRRCHIKESKGPVYKKNNNCFHNALCKYGSENFAWEIIDFADTQEALDAKEVFWIKEFCSLSKENGYNLKRGGNSGQIYTEEARKHMSDGRKGKGIGNVPWNKGKKHSESVRLKISFSLMGNSFRKGKLGKNNKPRIIKEKVPYVFTIEHRRKISEAQKGNKYCLGHKLSDECKRKLSEARKGNHNRLGSKQSSETKLKISLSLKGRIFSEETLRKMSIAQKGHPGYMKGKHLTEDQRNKISGANRRRKGKKRSCET